MCVHVCVHECYFLKSTFLQIFFSFHRVYFSFSSFNPSSLWSATLPLSTLFPSFLLNFPLSLSFTTAFLFIPFFSIPYPPFSYPLLFSPPLTLTIHLLTIHHSPISVINHLDISSDGRFLQSNCSAYELLFSDAHTGQFASIYWAVLRLWFLVFCFCFLFILTRLCSKLVDYMIKLFLVWYHFCLLAPIYYVLTISSLPLSISWTLSLVHTRLLYVLHTFVFLWCYSSSSLSYEGKQLPGATELRDVQWDSWTCTLGTIFHDHFLFKLFFFCLLII